MGLSGNQCAFPGCTRILVNEKDALGSNICHIEAANIDGERYNPDMTDADRASFDNLILLCPHHHSETDDVEKYTVDVLKKMKKDHEGIMLNEKIKSNPSMLKNAINAIANIDIEEYKESESLVSFNPSDKLIYNCVQRNVSIIEEYKSISL